MDILAKRTHINRNTDKNYEVCLQITSRFGLAKVIVSVKRTRVLENISEILTVSSPFTLFHMFWIKFSTMVKHSSVTGVLELSGAPTTYLDLDRVRLTLLRICKQNEFWQLTLKWLSRARAQDKTKQYYRYFFSFFARFYSIMRFKDSHNFDEHHNPFRMRVRPPGFGFTFNPRKEHLFTGWDGEFYLLSFIKSLKRGLPFQVLGS